MWKQIVKTTLIAGILDICAACIQAYLSHGVMPSFILKYIASGAFGQSAFDGGIGMILLGLLFHFIIVFACTAIFFMLYPKMDWLNVSIILNSILIAFVAWGITNLLILKMSRIPDRPIHLVPSFIAIGILVITIGLPLSVFAKKYYGK
jgi:hypothetical protein